ncbi:hypothetical protein CORC01_08614 [Colletotrichum orchidophilum]|uniref:Uncharacterized protein n=1 Tax=Colletotrichum orchidophilum TaxID=1209926 RepID=A0A1G4B3V4_9PEZI|nr:uncharacterized protein CORC01_08614 [Colletotrichum orchidophilum]OHE96077.1 hypothetical protein CORC01_08614 [Colletotrichum orchidophilum]
MTMYSELNNASTPSHGIEMDAPTCYAAGATLSASRILCKSVEFTSLASKQQSKQASIHFAESPARAVSRSPAGAFGASSLRLNPYGYRTHRLSRLSRQSRQALAQWAEYVSISRPVDG